MSQTDPLEIGIPDLKLRLDRAGRDFVLLDIREPHELGRGVLPGAVLLPMSQIVMRHRELDPGTEIICYCEHGIRSYNVAAWLQDQGYRARSLAGGFAEWNGPRVPFEP